MIDHSKARNKWTCWAIRPPSSQCIFGHPVVGTRSSAYEGWDFLHGDRQNDPSDLSGLQLKAEQEHSQGRDWKFHLLSRAQSSQAGGVGATRSKCWGGGERELNWWLNSLPLARTWHLLVFHTAYDNLLPMNSDKMKITTSSAIFAEHILCARHCDKYFIRISSYNCTSVFISFGNKKPEAQRRCQGWSGLPVFLPLLL